MDDCKKRTWAEIDLSAIAHNVHVLKGRTAPGTLFMAVVKANGYGHGARPVAQAMVAGGADWCGLARIEEALQLRRAGISCRMLVLGYTPPAKIPEAIEQNIAVALIDPELTRAYLEYARINGGVLHAHVKVETGMGRLGMPPEQIASFLRGLQGSEIQVDGIFTHFASADEPASGSTLRQLNIFNQLLEELAAEGLKPPIVHAANSAAIFNFPQSYYDLVRPGDILFGGVNAATRSTDPLQPCNNWAAVPAFSDVF